MTQQITGAIGAKLSIESTSGQVSTAAMTFHADPRKDSAVSAFAEREAKATASTGASAIETRSSRLLDPFSLFIENPFDREQLACGRDSCVTFSSYRLQRFFAVVQMPRFQK